MMTFFSLAAFSHPSLLYCFIENYALRSGPNNCEKGEMQVQISVCSKNHEASVFAVCNVCIMAVMLIASFIAPELSRNRIITFR